MQDLAFWIKLLNPLVCLQMDADYDPVADMERKKNKKDKKKKNKLAQALTSKKPVFDPSKCWFLNVQNRVSPS